MSDDTLEALIRSQIESRAVGRSSVSRLRRPELVGALVAAARDLVAATGGALAACPTYGRAAR